MGLGNFTRFKIIIKHGTFGVHGDNFHCRILFLDVAPHTAQRASGTNSAHDVINVAIHLFPDFRAGGAVMRFNIHRIVVLVRVKCAGNFLGQPPGNAVVAFRGIGGNVRRGHNHFRAKCPHQVNLFVTHFIGNGDDAAVPLYGGNHRQRSAGVPGRIFHDGPAGLQQPFAFRIFNNEFRHAVFYASAGIEKFQFGKEPPRSVTSNFMKLHHGGVANGIQNIFGYVHMEFPHFH